MHEQERWFIAWWLAAAAIVALATWASSARADHPLPPPGATPDVAPAPVNPASAAVAPRVHAAVSPAAPPARAYYAAPFYVRPSAPPPRYRRGRLCFGGT